MSTTSASSPRRLIVGARYCIQRSDGTVGRRWFWLRYVGRRLRYDGEWAGVELQHPNGEFDGTEYGKVYFKCRPNYGKWFRPKQLALYVNSGYGRASGTTYRAAQGEGPVGVVPAAGDRGSGGWLGRTRAAAGARPGSARAAPSAVLRNRTSPSRSQPPARPSRSQSGGAADPNGVGAYVEAMRQARERREEADRMLRVATTAKERLQALSPSLRWSSPGLVRSEMIPGQVVLDTHARRKADVVLNHHEREHRLQHQDDAAASRYSQRRGVRAVDSPTRREPRARARPRARTSTSTGAAMSPARAKIIRLCTETHPELSGRLDELLRAYNCNDPNEPLIPGTRNRRSEELLLRHLTTHIVNTNSASSSASSSTSNANYVAPWPFTSFPDRRGTAGGVASHHQPPLPPSSSSSSTSTFAGSSLTPPRPKRASNATLRSARARSASPQQQAAAKTRDGGGGGFSNRSSWLEQLDPTRVGAMIAFASRAARRHGGWGAEARADVVAGFGLRRESMADDLYRLASRNAALLLHAPAPAPAAAPSGRRGVRAKPAASSAMVMTQKQKLKSKTPQTQKLTPREQKARDGLTKDVLVAYYRRHGQFDKLAAVDAILDHNNLTTATVVQTCREKYGDSPLDPAPAPARAAAPQAAPAPAPAAAPPSPTLSGKKRTLGLSSYVSHAIWQLVQQELMQPDAVDLDGQAAAAARTRNARTLAARQQQWRAAVKASEYGHKVQVRAHYRGSLGEKMWCTDFAPKVFHALRTLVFGVTSEAYIRSMHGQPLVDPTKSQGKSNALFFTSQDGKYVVKTVKPGELPVLLDLLPHYCAHVLANPASLLPRFFGLHRVELHSPRQQHIVVVMRNILPAPSDAASSSSLAARRNQKNKNEINFVYDLKGSTYRRYTPTTKAKAKAKTKAAVADGAVASAGSTGSVGDGSDRDRDQDQGGAASSYRLPATLKDLNFVSTLMLDSAEMRTGLLQQLEVDATFLQTHGLMDYSLLLACTCHYDVQSQEGIASGGGGSREAGTRTNGATGGDGRNHGRNSPGKSKSKQLRLKDSGHRDSSTSSTTSHDRQDPNDIGVGAAVAKAAGAGAGAAEAKPKGMEDGDAAILRAAVARAYRSKAAQTELLGPTRRLTSIVVSAWHLVEARAGKKKYITYKIELESASSSSSTSAPTSWAVFRRYSQFEKLAKDLAEENKATGYGSRFVEMLPESGFMSWLNNFSPQFLHRRRSELDQMLRFFVNLFSGNALPGGGGSAAAGAGADGGTAAAGKAKLGGEGVDVSLSAALQKFLTRDADCPPAAISAVSNVADPNTTGPGGAAQGTGGEGQQKTASAASDDRPRRPQNKNSNRTRALTSPSATSSSSAAASAAASAAGSSGGTGEDASRKRKLAAGVHVAKHPPVVAARLAQLSRSEGVRGHWTHPHADDRLLRLHGHGAYVRAGDRCGSRALPVTFYVGIIDILQAFTAAKKAESIFKANLLGHGMAISAVEPALYRDRFLKFITQSVKVKRGVAAAGRW